MITNIIDRRKRFFRWREVNAVIESTWHDNDCKDADQATSDAADQVAYDQRMNISVEDAIKWASAETAEVTLFLYDKGEGIAPL